MEGRGESRQGPTPDRSEEGTRTSGSIRQFARRLARNARALVSKDLTEELTAAKPSGGYGTYGVRASEQATLAEYGRMSEDSQFSLGLALIKAPLIAVEWWVDPATDSPRDAEAAEFVEANLKTLWLRLMRTALTAGEYGFAAHEKVFTVDGGKYSLDAVKDLDPLKCEILRDDTGHFGGVRYSPGGGAAPVDLSPEKCFVMTFARKWGNLYGTSWFTRGAVRTWRRAEKADDGIDRYFDRKADPLIKGRAPAGKQTDASGSEVDNLEACGAAVSAARSGGNIVFPSGAGEDGKPAWDLEYLIDDKRADMFLAFIDHLDTRKLRSLLIPDRILEQTDTGAYGLVDRVTATFIQMEESRLAELFEHVQKYIAGQLVELNFGDGAAVEVKYRGLSDESKKLIADVVKALLTGPIPSADVAARLDVDQMIEATGLPLRQTGDAGAKLSRGAGRRTKHLELFTKASLRRAADRARARQEEIDNLARAEAVASSGAAKAAEALDAQCETIAAGAADGRGIRIDLLPVIQAISNALFAADIQARAAVVAAADERGSRRGGAGMARHFAAVGADTRAAVEYLKRRGVMTDSEVQALGEECARQAFTVAGIEEKTLLERIKSALVDAIAKGTTADKFRDVVKQALADAGAAPLSRGQIDLVFQMNVRSAFHAARWQAFQSAPVKEIFKAFQYVTIGDDRVRPAHAAMDGRVFAADDPIWRTWWPPNGFNCRCTTVAVDKWEIESGAVAVEPSTNVSAQPDPGFDTNVGIEPQAGSGQGASTGSGQGAE